MNIDKFKAIAMRFVKGFIAGGVGAVVSLIGTGAVIHNFADTKALVFAAATAFIAGGLLAIEKLLNWQPPQEPTPPIGSEQ
jgi:hypothetical protein